MANRLQVLGAIHNFVEQAGNTPLELAHQGGLTFVAMDARAFPHFRGATPAGEWVVARSIRAELPQLEPWPDTGWRFAHEADARQAYRAMREHVLARLPGLQPRDERGPERRLCDPSTAWGESFSWQGNELVYLSCDRVSEARVLEMITDRLEALPLRQAPQVRLASYNTQTAPHVVAIGTNAQGLAEHVMVAFTPGNELERVASGLPGAELEVEPFPLELLSGVLVISWGRVDGAAYFANAPNQDPANVLGQLLGHSVAAPLPSTVQGAPGPVAWAMRVEPGAYECSLRFLQTTIGGEEYGISCMVLSHAAAAPLWSAGGAMGAIYEAESTVRTAQARVSGDPDPALFPGKPLARLSDYVRLLRAMRAGDLRAALQQAGLDMGTYPAAAEAWGLRMAQDPALSAKFALMMAQP